MVLSRNFVIGDIHGAYRALKQCLDRAGFDYAKDHLICLGDVCDGWPETREAIDELLQIKNLIFILGNHDALALEWMQTQLPVPGWRKQGGAATMKSYVDGVPKNHIELLANAAYYYLHRNKLFVHAGIKVDMPIAEQDSDILLWDRELSKTVLHAHFNRLEGKLTQYDEIYIGHTPVPTQMPLHQYEVWMMDTGAGWSGVLTMMDVDTKEIITSDSVPSLYPGVEGRNKKKP